MPTKSTWDGMKQLNIFTRGKVDREGLFGQEREPGHWLYRPRPRAACRPVATLPQRLIILAQATEQNLTPAPSTEKVVSKAMFRKVESTCRACEEMGSWARAA